MSYQVLFFLKNWLKTLIEALMLVFIYLSPPISMLPIKIASKLRNLLFYRLLNAKKYTQTKSPAITRGAFYISNRSAKLFTDHIHLRTTRTAQDFTGIIPMQLGS